MPLAAVSDQCRDIRVRRRLPSHAASATGSPPQALLLCSRRPRSLAACSAASGKNGELAYTNRLAGHVNCTQVSSMSPIAHAESAGRDRRDCGAGILAGRGDSRAHRGQAAGAVAVQRRSRRQGARRCRGGFRNDAGRSREQAREQGAARRGVQGQQSPRHYRVHEYPSVGPQVSGVVTYISNCYACDVRSKVNFTTTRLNRDAYRAEIAAAAIEFGVEESLLRAVVHAESAFNPNALSNKGAQGLMQLMPGTADDMGVDNPFDATENIRGGAQYLAYLLKELPGRRASRGRRVQRRPRQCAEVRRRAAIRRDARLRLARAYAARPLSGNEPRSRHRRRDLKFNSRRASRLELPPLEVSP